MMLRFVAICMAVSACAEPVVEMEMRMPANASTFDASCVTGVTVVVAGANIASDPSDYTWSCREITPQQRLAGVRDAIRGTFDIAVPASGVAGIEVMGWSGASPCEPPGWASPDLIFHGSGTYIGQDVVDVAINTTLDCAQQTVKVRPVEMFALVGGTTPSSASCASAGVPDAATDNDKGWASLGHIMERPFSDGVDYWGGMRGGYVTGGLATFDAPMTGMTKSCLAYDAYSPLLGYATGCVMNGGKVCAAADEIEAPFVNGTIADETRLRLDEALLTKWDNMVFVSVWDSGNPRKPIVGATIEIAAADGAVVYVDPPATSGTSVTKRSDNATGTSGLAVVYTNKLSKVKVTANGATREVTVATPDWGADWTAGAALVVMP